MIPRPFAELASVGSAVPARVLTNHDLTRTLDTSDEWIVERTGIRERRIAGPEQTVAMLSASQLKDVTIFGLGIMPYISASIIFQLLASVYAPLEQLQKEGESGRKKINEYTRYATFVLCIFQSWFYIESYVETQGLVALAFQSSSGQLVWY